MALQFNSFSKSGLLLALRQANLFGGSGHQLRIFPTTVPYPAAALSNSNSLPVGHILAYTGLTYTVTGNTLSITAGTTSGTALAAGTLGWVAMFDNNSAIVTDSIGVSGSGSIITVNNMTPAAGQSVTITFNLTLV